MKQIIIAAFVALLAGCSSGFSALAPSSSVVQSDADEMAIRSILAAQAMSWNQGDIDGFMEGYWESDALRFASGGNVLTGYQATYERYLATYPDRAAMGALSFTQLAVDVLSDDAAVVHGAWQLDRANDAPSGLFTLVFRDFGEGWVIVSDTTTSAD